MPLRPWKTTESDDLEVRTDIFNFHPAYIVVSLAHPDENVIHIGGNHTDSPHPKQKWQSVDEAVDKISHKASDMEVKRLYHELEYPGSKSAIFAPCYYLTGAKRVNLFKILGQVVNYYEGKIHTAADVNTKTHDLMISHTISPYIVGLPKEYGGTGDPSPHTAEDVVAAQKILLKRMGILEKRAHDLQGITFAIKGAAGAVGRNLVRMLYREKATLYVSDINEEGLNEVCEIYSRVIKVHDPDIIHKKIVSVFCPADTTITLPDENTVRELGCKLICGPANDQNRSDELEDLVYELDIYHSSKNGALENGGGIISVLPESERYKKRKHFELVEKIGSIYDESKAKKTPPYKILRERYLSK